MAAEGAYWMNTYEPEWNYGPAFFDARHNFVFSANYELPFGKGPQVGQRLPRAVSTPSSAAGGSAASSRRGRASRSRSSTAATPRCKDSAGTSGPTASAIRCPADQNINHWLDINAFQRVPRGTWGNCPIGVARAPGYQEPRRSSLAKRFSAGGERDFEFRAEAFNLTNTPSFGPPARDINAPNTFGTITSTVSTARTVELVLKFFF